MQAFAGLLVDEHNSGLHSAMAQFVSEQSDADVSIFDLHALERLIRTNAASYNITNLSEPCYTWQHSGMRLAGYSPTPTVCSNANNHAFWDALHPAKVVHQLWGEALATQLQPHVPKFTDIAASSPDVSPTQNGSHLQRNADIPSNKSSYMQQ